MADVAAASIPADGLAPTACPRLLPVARSWNPLVWLGALMYRLGAGGVATPIWVIFARAPRLLLAHLVLVATSEYGVTLPRRLRSLVRVYGSRVNGCLFCDDLETRLALDHGAISQADADALPEYTSSSLFSDGERAALRYVEEVNLSRRASDDVFDELREHFSEREVVEITWLNAVGNYLNLQARPLGLLPEGACELPARPGPAAGSES